MTDKVELKSSHEVIYTVDVADVESIFQGKPIDPDILTVLMKDGKRLYCDEVCPIDSMQEEQASEDLSDYINELSKQFPEVSFAKLSRIAVRAAKWQKQQDQSTIELAEDHAMLAGMEKMKEQMMKDAIERKVKVDAGGYPYIDCDGIELYDYENDKPLARKGQKAKVIIILED